MKFVGQSKLVDTATTRKYGVAGLAGSRVYVAG
jgi:hypothetical protein